MLLPTFQHLTLVLLFLISSSFFLGGLEEKFFEEIISFFYSSYRMYCISLKTIGTLQFETRIERE